MELEKTARRVSYMGLLLVVGGWATGAWADSAASWVPLAVGSTWEYETEDQSQIRIGEFEHSTRLAGRVVVTVDRELPEGVYVVTTAIQNETSSGNAASGLRTDHLAYLDGSLVVHARGYKQQGTFIQSDSFDRFDPPDVRLKHPLAEGEKWRVGTHDGEIAGEQGAQTESAEVLGREAVDTPAGRFDDCLKVAYQTTAGVVLSPDASQNVRDGDAKEKRVEWFARNVGLVKRVSTSQLEGVRPDGLRIRISHTTTEILQSYRMGSD